MTEQAESLVKIATKIYKKLNSQIGVPINTFDIYGSEKVRIYIDYDPSKCTRVESKSGEFRYWDIPEYTNGSTRHARCIFLIPCLAVADACYAYIVSDNSKMEEKFKESPLYDREILLIKEYFDDQLVELIWSFDFASPHSSGQHWYSVDDFWFGVKINGILVQKVKDIKDLSIPNMEQRCVYCQKNRKLSELRFTRKTHYKGIIDQKWMCKTEFDELYSKCPI